MSALAMQQGIAAGRGPALRLTQRGRRALAGALATFVVGLGWVAASASATVNDQSRVVLVQPGQTLSQIAADQLPELSISDAVVRFVEVNALPSAELTAGQRLRVPAVDRN